MNAVLDIIKNSPKKCTAKDIEDIKQILEKNRANIDAQDMNGDTSLISCCGDERCVEIVKLLIKNNANINLQNNYGETALTYASMYSCKNDIEIAKLLLKNGADVHIQDNYGNTAIMTTSQYVDDETCSLKMSRLLLEYDAKPYDTHDINIFVGNIAKLNALS